MQLACPHCQQILQFSGKRPAFCAYCGKALPTPSEDATIAFDGPSPVASEQGDDPSEIGGYRLLRRLGEGGMGRVYEAEEIATGRRVALKLISADYAASAAAVERFRREGRLASGVSHPRCVFVISAEEAEGRPYIVMELMPGSTLQDLVDKEGPLAVEKALLKILDVMEGLREAHRLGVIHRDVKPSNCFLEADGRVKIGDFGLSKSLVDGGALTRTGTFLGTPLFASPEQIKGGEIGPQSDVYSVAATLYCLLTGKAPFQGGDPAATLARIVSDQAPSMRTLRRDVPAALDQTVLRGLERDPARRWRDLDDFQAALLPFVSGRLSIGGLGVRFGAFLIDYGVLLLASFPILFATLALTGGGSPWDPELRIDRQLLQLGSGLAVWLLYFGGCEGVWGCTLGKRWLGLRVCKAKGGERPGLAASMLRVALFFVLLNMGTLTVQVLTLAGLLDMSKKDPNSQMQMLLVLGAGFYPLEALGIVLLFCTMRARNGYRGMHEILSGTRVVQLPRTVRGHALLGRDLELATSPPEGLPARIGPFDVLGVLPGAGVGRLLLGQDASLGRRAWIWLRSADDAPLSAARRDLSRTTRLRWVAGGREERGRPDGAPAESGIQMAESPQQGEVETPDAAPQYSSDESYGDWQWDAFLAPVGGVLVNATATVGTLSWGETRQVLGQLAEELNAAAADGTLPATLTTGQVWLRPDGRVFLLDAPVGRADASTDSSPLALLANTAMWALGATPLRRNRGPTSFGVPLPLHAATILDRLLGAGKLYSGVPEFQKDLAAAIERPAETTRPRRLAHIALQMAFWAFGLCVGITPVLFMPPMMVVISTFRIHEMEKVRERLTELITVDDAAVVAEDDPFRRQAALMNAQEDAQLGEALDSTIGRLRQEREARMNALSWLGKEYAKAVQKQIEDTEKAQGNAHQPLPPDAPPSLIRLQARVDAQPESKEEQAWVMAIMQTIMLAFWPVLWILWAFVTRGGLSFYLMSLALVRRNGRPALRIQCAWRAFLFWAPVTGLSLASIWLDATYWMGWTGAGSNAWMLTASAAVWWWSLALLPLYLMLALCFPRRSLHDVLAGTYLVPR